MRAGDIALYVLVCLIVVAPLLWFAGVPLERVGAAVGWWALCFVVVSWLGGRYGRFEK